MPTVTDILRELEKPGRDPRPAFKTAAFAEGVETMADLAPGMVLEGSVTNVAAFGAFVDIGVHQDGLVHVSAMSRNFVSDPREVAKPGDVVRVKVLGVDIPRKRISLTMRLDDESDGRGADSSGRTGRGPATTGRGDNRRNEPPGNSAMADALRRAGLSAGGASGGAGCRREQRQAVRGRPARRPLTPPAPRRRPRARRRAPAADPHARRWTVSGTLRCGCSLFRPSSSGGRSIAAGWPRGTLNGARPGRSGVTTGDYPRPGTVLTASGFRAQE